MPYAKGAPFLTQFVDSSGNPIENGSIEFFLWGTSTPTNVYSDASGTSAGTSVTLDSRGAPQNSGTPIDLYFDVSVVYKIVVKDSAGSAISPTIGPYYGTGVGGNGVALAIDAVDSAASNSLYDYTGTSDGQQVEVGGYYSVGDGGGGRFYWDDSSSDTDDGGLTILPTGHLTAGRWKRIIPEDGHLHAEWFGAKGDNSTNNTSFIQTAIDAVESLGGGVLHFGTGAFRSGPLTLPERHITLQGILAGNYRTDESIDATFGTTLVATDDVNDFITISSTIQTQKVNLNDITLRSLSGAAAGRGVYCDTSTYVAFLFDTTRLKISGFDIGYHVERHFYTTHTELTVWDNRVGYYGGASVSNVYINPDVGLVRNGGVGFWVLGRSGAVYASSTAAETSEADSVLWRVGTSALYNEGGLTGRAANMAFYSPHFEGAKENYLHVASGSQVVVYDMHCITSGDELGGGLPAAVRFEWLDKVSRFVNPRFESKDGGTYTYQFLVDAVLKGSGKLIIEPNVSDEVPVVSGLTIGNGLAVNSEVAVIAYLSATSTLTTAVELQIPFDQRAMDTGNNWDDTTNYEFTAPQDGFYRVTLEVRISDAVDQDRYQLRLYKNEAEYRRVYRIVGRAGDNTVGLNALVDMEAGDTLDARVYYPDGGTRTVYNGVYGTRLDIEKTSA